MLISTDNDCRIIGWREIYFSGDEIVNVTIGGNITTIFTRNRTSGRVDSKTLFGKPPLPSTVSAGNTLPTTAAARNR